MGLNLAVVPTGTARPCPGRPAALFAGGRLSYRQAPGRLQTPRIFQFRSELPKNTLGKILKDQLVPADNNYGRPAGHQEEERVTACAGHTRLPGSRYQPGVELAGLRAPRAGPGRGPGAACAGAGQVCRDHGHALRRVRDEADRRPQSALAGDVRFREARNAVYVVFFGNGFLFANWAARIPQVRSGLGVTPGVRGLILLCLAAGPGSAPLSGLIIGRLGESRTVRVMAATAVPTAGLLLIEFGAVLSAVMADALLSHRLPALCFPNA